MRLFVSLLVLGWATFSDVAAATPVSDGDAMQTDNYVFAWPFVDGAAMQPRGGTTRGTALELDTGANPAWQALHEPGLSSFERDRRAILAMAGEYRTSFDFLEIAGYTANYTPQRPYRSWGTEKVYVLEDRGDFISLQHVLVMRILNDDGEQSAPIVTKHWRQDWQFEPESVLVYRGRDTWERTPISLAERRSAWSQTVYQVDDSPRYGDVARWQHRGDRSSWEAHDGWRPLPRREFSIRDDYDVLIGSNRHTIVPNGWVHEQRNDKVALARRDLHESELTVLASEIGVNRYERIRGYDFGPGDRYLERTAELWAVVRDAWAALTMRAEPLRLRGAPDEDQLFLPLWAYAAEIDAGKEVAPDTLAARVRELVRSYLFDADAQPDATD